MTAILVEIKNDCPLFFESGKTISDLKLKLDIDGHDVHGYISAIESADISGVDCKFEIKPNLWLLIS